MEISYLLDTGHITQAGISLGDLNGHAIAEVDDDIWNGLEPGTRSFHPEDGTITVTPPEPIVTPDPGPDPRVAAVEALIATATSPEQAAALRQFAIAFGIDLPQGG